MNNATPKWYIATTIIGNEEVVYKNIEDKIRAYGLNDLVKEIKLLKSREITIEIFDNKTNPPPKLMRNTKSITWETLPGNKYKKTRIREVNRFPGYIYIQMIMTQEAWYAIRNTYGITGFVGSSGKGAQPIPMSDQDVEALFDPSLNKDIIINKSENAYSGYAENTIDAIKNEVNENKKSGEIEFLNGLPNIVAVNNKPFVVNNDGFYDSKLEQQQTETANESKFDFDFSENDSEMHNEFMNEINTVEKTRDMYISDHDDSENNNMKFDDKFTPDYSLKVGTFIRIIAGEMKDTCGYIVAIDSENNKLEIEIELLNKKNRIIVNISDVTTEDVK